MKQRPSVEEIRHSLAHLLAIAVKRMYPKAKLGIGPAIDSGFYYDFDNIDISKNDLKEIEKEMRSIASQHLAFKKELWTKQKAKKQFKGEPYKLELIKELKGAKVGIVHTGDIFLDLCRGGHVVNTIDIPVDAFKLTKVAGAYWKGDEKRPMLTRIYGAAFATEKELKQYVEKQKEAEKRDHKKLGKELGLFINSDLVGSGLPLFTPKGTVIFNQLQMFTDKLKEEIGFKNVRIPHIAKKDLYRVSGHLEKFGDDIFKVLGKNTEFILKPMNCPHHIQIYASQQRSYKDLPVSFYETTTTYRDEQTGELGGLTRVRSITMDDSHSFIRPDQIEEGFEKLIKQVIKVAKTFNLTDFTIRLSQRDEKNKSAYLGSDAIWKKTQKQMEDILKRNKIAYTKAQGEAAFYGPKMDFMINDSLGREWQISTIQLDLNLPERFNLEYIDKNGKPQRPALIHSAFLGSIERFFGILIEHYGGAFPLWLAPEQIWILPIGEKFNKKSKELKEEFLKAFPELRIVIKDDNETLGKKIREGELQKIPYLLILGKDEISSKTISVRKRQKGDLGSMKTNDFVKLIAKELK